MQRILRMLAFGIVLMCAMGFGECYKPVTKNQLPKHIKTTRATPRLQIELLVCELLQ